MGFWVNVILGRYVIAKTYLIELVLWGGDYLDEAMEFEISCLSNGVILSRLHDISVEVIYNTRL